MLPLHGPLDTDHQWYQADRLTALWWGMVLIAESLSKFTAATRAHVRNVHVG